MRPSQHRKIPRFFVINPEQDRRQEVRFVSRENVVVRIQKTQQVYPGIAYDIGQTGLKLEIDNDLPPNADIQVAFPNSSDHVHCFGRIIWVRPLTKSHTNEIGIAVHTWLGIVDGADSWKQFKGLKPKHDRRSKPR